MLEQLGNFSLWTLSPAATAVGGELELCAEVPALLPGVVLKVQAGFDSVANIPTQWAADLGWTGPIDDLCYALPFQGVLTIDSIDVTQSVWTEPWGAPDYTNALCNGGGSDGFYMP